MSQPDPRAELYDDLHAGQMAEQERQNGLSADRILRIVFEFVQPTSVLDVGCGLGTWLAAAKNLGISNLHGIEGPWLQRDRLAIDSDLVETLDLENGFSLGRKFDLTICLEVAEHLPEKSASKFVESLAEHGDLTLFSAAIPFQGGHHHVNEQFPDYWAERFATHGFRPIDFIRPRIWTDPNVLWWLKQNVILFAHDRVIESNAALRAQAEFPRPLSVVHPDVYLGRLLPAQRLLAEHQALINHLSSGGTFVVTRSPDGRLNINKQ